MKKYFEYNFNDEIADKLIKYYENTELYQQYNPELKCELKLLRIKSMVTFSRDDIVLDVGCFKGHILRGISNHIRKGIGIDVSRAIISLNKDLNNQDNIDYSEFDGVDIGHESQFDKILVLDVLEHAFYPDQLIESICRALKPNGELILEVPYTGWLSELFAGKYHAGHLRYYDSKYLSAYLRKRNLRLKDLRMYNSVPLSSFFLKYKSLHCLLDYLVNLIPPIFYPYFGEILVVSVLDEM